MSRVGKPERATQDRVLGLFRDELGYQYLGDWTHREGNNNIEEALLSASLRRRAYTDPQIRAAIHKLQTEARHHGRTLYENTAPSTASCATAFPSRSRLGESPRRCTSSTGKTPSGTTSRSPRR